MAMPMQLFTFQTLPSGKLYVNVQVFILNIIFNSLHLMYGPILALSISTHNPEKLNQIGFNPP